MDPAQVEHEHLEHERLAQRARVGSPATADGPRPASMEEAHPAALEEARPAPAEGRMKCVWSGHLARERDCRSRIPASVVVKAWQRERQLKETAEGFFYFAWRSGVWLAFGVRDGSVRGVYCPTHCSERDARETQDEDRQEGGPAGLPLGGALQ